MILQPADRHALEVAIRVARWQGRENLRWLLRPMQARAAPGPDGSVGWLGPQALKDSASALFQLAAASRLLLNGVMPKRLPTGGILVWARWMASTAGLGGCCG